jgi:uncharacterized membrane protein YccC
MASTDELKDSLKELRAALAAGEPLSGEQREQLDAVLADLGRLLEGEEEYSHESLAERLRETAEHFEDTHPDLTLAVGTLVRVLNRMGI